MGLIRKQPKNEEQPTRLPANSGKSTDKIKVKVETIGVDNPTVDLLSLSKGGEIIVTIPVICFAALDCGYVENKRDIKVRLTIV